MACPSGPAHPVNRFNLDDRIMVPNALLILGMRAVEAVDIHHATACNRQLVEQVPTKTQG